MTTEQIRVLFIMLKKSIREPLIIFLLFIFAVILFALVIHFGTTNLGRERKDVNFGVTFSKIQAQSLGLDWKEAYGAVLEDLGARLVRIPIYWDDVEQKEGIFDLSDYEWMIGEAQKRGVVVIPIIGMRVPRWPECHIPPWAENSYHVSRITYQESNSPQPPLKVRGGEGGVIRAEELDSTPLIIAQSEEGYVQYLQQKILELLEREVKELKEYPNILYWQVENEPLLGAFGKCPFHDLEFVKKEFQLVKSLDPRRPVMTSDSGELSSWIDLAEAADVLGVSLYRTTFNKYFGIFFYPLPPLYYQKKAELVSHLTDEVIISELQGEPWVEGLLRDMPLDKQLQNFPLRRLKDSVSFAKKTQFDTILLWGVEWWYSLESKHNHPEYWEYMKIVISD